MAGITLEQTKAKLANAMAAYDAALNAQEYRAGANKGKRMAELRSLRDDIVFWDNMVKRLSRGGIGVRGVTPI